MAASLEVSRLTRVVRGRVGGTCGRENLPRSVDFGGETAITHTLHWSSGCPAARCRKIQTRLGRHFPRYRGQHALWEEGWGVHAGERISPHSVDFGGDTRKSPHDFELKRMRSPAPPWCLHPKPFSSADVEKIQENVKRNTKSTAPFVAHAPGIASLVTRLLV